MVYQYFYQTPADFSDLILQSDGEYLTGLFFDSAEAAKDVEIRDLPIFQETRLWLDQYFHGEIPDFTPKYKVENLTPFRQAVLDILKTIPYGKTLTYGEIAQRIAQQRGIAKMSNQAVGNAVGWNPICIIIPCHRVIGANGNLTGYSSGLPNKIALLTLEKHNISKFSLPKVTKQ